MNGTTASATTVAAAWSTIVTRITLPARVASPAVKSEQPNPMAASNDRTTASMHSNLPPGPAHDASRGHA